MPPSALTRLPDNAGRYAAAAIGFSLPISIVIDNILLAIVLVGWGFGGHYRIKLNMIRNNLVCFCALCLFVVLLLGAFRGLHPFLDARQHLFKYFDLAMVPLFAYYFRDPVTRQQAIFAFAASMALVLAYSLLVKFQILTNSPVIHGSTGSPVVFKFRVTHNFLMAFAAFLFIHLVIASRSSIEKVICAALAFLAIINVTLMVEGATGYIVLFALLLFLVCSQLPKRWVVVAMVSIPALVTVLTILPGPLSKRVATIANEVQTWRPGTSALHSSAGTRLEFYRNSIDIVADNPVFGVGTGGFAKAYAEKVRGTGMIATQNAHNEYLMIMVQNGLIGVAALLALFATQWSAAKRLQDPLEAGLARGLVLSMAIGCVFNSFLLDHTEGLFFAWFTGLLYSSLSSPDSSVKPGST